jgi:hypothetical protein
VTNRLYLLKMLCQIFSLSKTFEIRGGYVTNRCTDYTILPILMMNG